VYSLIDLAFALLYHLWIQWFAEFAEDLSLRFSTITGHVLAQKSLTSSPTGDVAIGVEKDAKRW